MKRNNKGYEVVAKRPRDRGSFKAGDRPKALPISIRFYQDQREELEAIADSEGIPLRELLIKWIDEKINEKD